MNRITQIIYLAFLLSGSGLLGAEIMPVTITFTAQGRVYEARYCVNEKMEPLGSVVLFSKSESGSIKYALPDEAGRSDLWYGSKRLRIPPQLVVSIEDRRAVLIATEISAAVAASPKNMIVYLSSLLDGPEKGVKP